MKKANLKTEQRTVKNLGRRQSRTFDPVQTGRTLQVQINPWTYNGAPGKEIMQLRHKYFFFKSSISAKCCCRADFHRILLLLYKRKIVNITVNCCFSYIWQQLTYRMQRKGGYNILQKKTSGEKITRNL